MSVRTASVAAFAATAGLLGGGLSTTAAQGSSGSSAASPLLWATVNVCDTAARPDTIGIRAQMPGSGVRAERMFMRFRVQYRSSVDGKWHDVGPAGDSGWVSVGSARFRSRQAGRNFVISAPEGGSGYRLRGAVSFQWRRGETVVRRASARTTSGRGATAGGDPRGFSAASCVVR